MQSSFADKLKAKVQGNAAVVEATSTPAAIAAAPREEAPKGAAPRINPPKLAAARSPAAVEAASEPSSAAVVERAEQGHARVAEAESNSKRPGVAKPSLAIGDVRDLFAASALQGFLARGLHAPFSNPNTGREVATLCYELADEMIKAR
jgi:hypothetical protein